MMPPRNYSRHIYTEGVQRDDFEYTRVWLTDRIPFEYRKIKDTIVHRVIEGDTLFNLAGRYYDGAFRPAGFWWVIADFQPQRILDPTIQLAPGSLLFIPSLRTIYEEIFDERRREDHVDNYDVLR